MDKFNKFFKYSIYIILIFLPFREIIGIYDNAYLKFIPDIIIMCIFLWYLIKNNFKIKLRQYDYFYALFIISGLLSSIINSISMLAILLHIRSFITMYLLFYIIRNTNYNVVFYKRCLKILMIDLSVLTIIGIGEYITGKIFFFPYEWLTGIKYVSNLSRMYTLLHSPNTFGYFAVMTITLYIYLYKNIDNKKWIYLLILFFLGILLTQSRSSQIALIISLIYWVIILQKNNDRKTIVKVIVILMVTLFCYQGCKYAKVLFFNSDAYKQFALNNNEANENIANSHKNSYSRWDMLENDDLLYSMKNGRLYNIQLGFKIWKTKPLLGTGFATYGTAGSSVVIPKLYKEYDLDDDFYSDNQYIAIIVETGIVGVILFLLFIISLIYEYKNNTFKLLIIFLLLLICLFYNVLELAVLMSLFYILISLNIDCDVVGDEKEKMKSNNNRKYIVFCQEHYNPLGIIRSLGQFGIKPIVIIKKGKYRLASKSKYIGKLHMVDTIEEGYDVLIKEYGKEKLKPFIYTSDDTITSFLDLKYNELSNKFIFYNAGEKGRVTNYMNKDNIIKVAEKCGLNIIKTWKLSTKQIPSDIEYPCITKAIISTKDNWKADSIICHNKKELEAALKKIDSKEILVQKFINKKNEFAVNGFSINKGKNVFYAFALNYLSIIDNKFGNYMIIKNFENKELEKKLDKVLEYIGFEGICEVEFLVDQNDELYFLEVNLRNSTWGYSATVAGMNLPVLWAEAMISHKLPKNKLKKFKEFKAMAEDTDFYDRVKTKKVSLIKWICQMLSCKCLYITNLRDMKPVYSKIGNIIKNKIKKA